MESSRKKEILAMIIGGIGILILPAVWRFVYLYGNECITLYDFIVYISIGWRFDWGFWAGWVVIALFLGGYGAFVARVGFRDYSSVKKLDRRAVILIIVGVLTYVPFLIGRCP